MKDFEMSRQERFLKAKEELDKALRVVKREGQRIAALAEDAEAESIVCCRSLELDTRDDLGALAGTLKRAYGLINQGHGELLQARSQAGRIDSGGITRGGGT